MFFTEYPRPRPLGTQPSDLTAEFIERIFIFALCSRCSRTCEYYLLPIYVYRVVFPGNKCILKMRIYCVFKATHSRMHVKWGLGPLCANEMNQKCPWSLAGTGTGTGAASELCAITNAIKISCHILITP